MVFENAMVNGGKQANRDCLDGDGELPAREDEELREVLDYYVEGGLLVFTAEFYEGVVTVARAAAAIVPIGTASHSKQVGA